MMDEKTLISRAMAALGGRTSKTEADYNALAYFGDPAPACKRCSATLPREFNLESFCPDCITNPRVFTAVREFATLKSGRVQ
jgi:hypothetical protein